MNDTILVHHGINGQKWGDRRYQNEDGSLTPLGRIHYGVGEARDRAKIEIKKSKAFAKSESRIIKAKAKAEIAKTKAAAKAQAQADKERIKAEAKAYKDKRQKNDEVEKEKIRADKDIEKEKIRTDKELELAAMKERQREAQEDRQFNKEMMKKGEKAEKKRINIENETVKKALKITAAVGIGYLLYKSLSSNGGIQGVSSSTMSAGQEVVNKNKGSLVSKIFNKDGKVSKSDAYSTLLGNKNLSKDEAAYYTKELFSNGTKSVPKATFDKFMELLENKVGHSAFSTEGQILMHSEENNMKDQVICHHGIKGQKWGVIRKKDDGQVKGRTKNIDGTVEGVTNKRPADERFEETLKSRPNQNFFTYNNTRHPIAKENYETQFVQFRNAYDDPAYAKFGAKPTAGGADLNNRDTWAYGNLGSQEGPKTKKEYIKFMEDEVNEILRSADKVGYEEVSKTLSKLIKKYSVNKIIKLVNGERVTYKDIQDVYMKAYSSIMKKYQEEQRYLRSVREKREKEREKEREEQKRFEESRKKKQEISNEFQKAKKAKELQTSNSPKTNSKDLKRINKIKHSSPDDMILIHSEDVCHWGILGMKWGVRRYQNPDGTLTELGKQHYGKKFSKKLEKADGEKDGFVNYHKVKSAVEQDKGIKAFNKEYNKSESGQKMINSAVDRQITTIKIMNDCLEKMNEKYGDSYPSPDETIHAQQQIELGKQIIKAEKRYSEEGLKTVNEYLESAQEYEDAAKSFLKDYLGESADKYSTIGKQSSYNEEKGTFETKDTTLQDRALSEMMSEKKIFYNKAVAKNLKRHIESLKDYDEDSNSWSIGNGKKVKTEKLAEEYAKMNDSQKLKLLEKLESSYVPDSKMQPIPGLNKAFEDIFKYEGKKEAKAQGYTDVTTDEDYIDLGRRKLSY